MTEQTFNTRAEYYANLLTMLQQGIIDSDAPIILTEAQWLEIAEVTKLPWPFRAPLESYIPDEEDLKRLEELEQYSQPKFKGLEVY